MLAQLTSSSDDVTTILIIAALLQGVLIIVFLVMASNVSAIRKRLDSQATAASPRRCQWCGQSVPPYATVCSHCTRDIGQPWMQDSGVWWTQRVDGSWFYLENGEWHEKGERQAPANLAWKPIPPP